MRRAVYVSKWSDQLSKIVIGLLVLIPFQALLTTWTGSNFSHLDLIRIWKEIILVILALPVCWLAWQSAQLRQWLVRSWLVRLFYLYILLHFILGAWAYAHGEINSVALIYALIVNLRFIAIFVICYILASYSKLLYENWLGIVLFPAAIVIAFGLLQKFVLPFDFLRHFGYGPNTIAAYQTVDANLDYRRIQSTLRGANPLGAYLVVVITALVVNFKKKWFQLLGLLAALVVLFFSYSRSAWAGLVISLALLVWWQISNRRLRQDLLIVSLVGALVLGGVAYSLRHNQRFQDTVFHTSNHSGSLESSNAERGSAIKKAAQDVIHQPLGRGPGTAGPASFRNNHPPRVAENYFLQLGQEVGILGMVIFITINGLVAYQLRLKRNALAKVLLASLIGLTLINLISHAWTDDTLVYLWWGLAGVALGTFYKKTV